MLLRNGIRVWRRTGEITLYINCMFISKKVVSFGYFSSWLSYLIKPSQVSRIQALFSNPYPAPLAYARKVEGDIYDTANSQVSLTFTRSMTVFTVFWKILTVMFFQEEYFYALAVNIYNIRIQHGIETRQEQDRDQVSTGALQTRIWNSRNSHILLFLLFFKLNKLATW